MLLSYTWAKCASCSEHTCLWGNIAAGKREITHGNSRINASILYVGVERPLFTKFQFFSRPNALLEVDFVTSSHCTPTSRHRLAQCFLSRPRSFCSPRNCRVVSCMFHPRLQVLVGLGPKLQNCNHPFPVLPMPSGPEMHMGNQSLRSCARMHGMKFDTWTWNGIFWPPVSPGFAGRIMFFFFSEPDTCAVERTHIALRRWDGGQT